MTNAKLSLGPDMNESALTYETPRYVLVKRIMALARAGEDVFGASHNDIDPHLHVTVGTEKAARMVREIAPEAIITIID